MRLKYDNYYYLRCMEILDIQTTNTAKAPLQNIVMELQ